MAEIIPWQANESSSLVILHLQEGKCVALPTETTYEIVASALHPAALASFPANSVPAIVLLDYAEICDWMPRLRGPGVRLFRKLGPGPVVLRADGGFNAGLWPRLPTQTQRAVARDGLLALRWPGHAVWGELRQAGLPLVSAALPGALTAQTTAELVGANVAVIVDGGPAALAEGPTTVRVEPRRCVVEQAGALTQEQIDELAMCRALFICTGNTCRSPLAEALCARLVADVLGVAPEELNRHGLCVQSAGLAARMGSAASPDSVTIAADLGADLSKHQSQMVTMEMLVWADHVFGMTAGHCDTLESILSDGMTLPRLLSPRHEDVSDPIGGELADYRTCASQILACLKERLPELLES